MSKLSWNEIRQRAMRFAHDFKGVKDERAEAQSFWNAFFQVFGLRRELVALFEERVKSLKGTEHRIDVFWPGTLLGEHKSVGQSLEKAHVFDGVPFEAGLNCGFLATMPDALIQVTR